MGAFPHFNRQFRYKFTVNSVEVDETLTDYPVYLDLSILPSQFFNNVNANGGDIIITDNSDNRLPVEVVFVDTVGNLGEVYFKAGISDTMDTDFFIYFGNSGANQPAVTDAFGRNAVWSNGYGAVYHFQDAATSIVDSTGNGNTGTPAGTLTVDTSAATNGGDGLIFDGTTSRINIGQDASIRDFTDDEMTISAWFKTTNVTDNRIISAWNGGANDDWCLRTGEGGDFLTSRLNGANQVENSAAIDDGNLHFGVLTYESGDRRTIRDGTNIASAMPTVTINNNNEDVFIGDRGSNNRKFDGTIDEVRIASVVRTNGWISTEYSNFTEAGFFTVDTTLETYNFITRFRNG